jgi:transcriptional regulator with XRE-family HTH domain
VAVIASWRVYLRGANAMVGPKIVLPSVLRLRLGAAIQKHRRQKGLTQIDLAEFTDLSLKYVGDIERGAANATLEVIERLAGAVGFDPFDEFAGLGEPLSEGVRLLPLDQIDRMLEQLKDMAKWLHALDPALNAQVKPLAQVGKRDTLPTGPQPPRRAAEKGTGREV